MVLRDRTKEISIWGKVENDELSICVLERPVNRQDVGMLTDGSVVDDLRKETLFVALLDAFDGAQNCPAGRVRSRGMAVVGRVDGSVGSRAEKSNEFEGAVVVFPTSEGRRRQGGVHNVEKTKKNVWG